ncbi:hypothetical protein SARC_13588, partial [Sphaeroforma arctica JP610]
TWTSPCTVAWAKDMTTPNGRPWAQPRTDYCQRSSSRKRFAERPRRGYRSALARASSSWSIQR